MAAPTGSTGMAGAGWSRRRLLVILAAAVTAGALLIGGLGYAVVHAVDDLGAPRSGSGGSAEAAAGGPVTVVEGWAGGEGQPRRGAAYRDRIAATPMLTAPESAMFPGGAAGAAVDPLVIPAGESPGPGQILTGFPGTPQGAVGQLAQLDVAVLQAMSPGVAAEVYRAWALPGGIGPDGWWVTRSVRAFLSAAAMGEVLDPAAAVVVEPAAALVKGTDGPDWLVACVLMRVSATYRREAQVAFAHCERMQWVGGRWMIAPGLPPAAAPATWPGTELAHQAGWRPWADAPTGSGAER